MNKEKMWNWVLKLACYVIGIVALNAVAVFAALESGDYAFGYGATIMGLLVYFVVSEWSKSRYQVTLVVPENLELVGVESDE